MTNKPKLDAATVRVIQKVLAMPPKPHDEMKVGRPAKKKKRGIKGPAVSAKPRSAS
jgi:hypothetical protein